MANLIKNDMREFRGEMKEGFSGIRRDARIHFRMLFWAIITFGLVLAGLLAKGFGWV
jgi:hypothetical protein